MTAFTSEREIAEFLAELTGETGEVDARRRIVTLLREPEEEVLRGLAGVSTRTFLEALLLTFTEEGRFAGPVEQAPQPVGKIQESVEGEPGFYFKPGEPMHVWVQLITRASRGDQAISKAEMYRVEVPAEQAAVERRAGTVASIFPGFENVAFAIPAGMAERMVGNEPVQMQYKLWAVGADVLVTDYWIDEMYDPGGDPNNPADPNWVRYTRETAPPHLRSIFETTPASCFDMLFIYDPTLDVADGGALDDGLLPPDVEPPYYCLGRCEHPPIVNTR